MRVCKHHCMLHEQITCDFICVCWDASHKYAWIKCMHEFPDLWYGVKHVVWYEVWWLICCIFVVSTGPDCFILFKTKGAKAVITLSVIVFITLTTVRNFKTEVQRQPYYLYHGITGGHPFIYKYICLCVSIPNKRTRAAGIRNSIFRTLLFLVTNFLHNTRRLQQAHFSSLEVLSLHVRVTGKSCLSRLLFSVSSAQKGYETERYKLAVRLLPSMQGSRETMNTVGSCTNTAYRCLISPWNRSVASWRMQAQIKVNTIRRCAALSVNTLHWHNFLLP